MMQAAEAAGRSVGATTHHFRVLQCPMNLFEAGATSTANTGQSQTVLEYARQNNIAVLVNRPLNAMVAPNRMLRLADLPLENPPIDIDYYLSKVGALEQEYRTSLAPNIPSSGTERVPAEYFTWSAELHRTRQQIQGLEHWEQLEHQMIAPHINQVLQLLSQQLSGDVAEQWEALEATVHSGATDAVAGVPPRSDPTEPNPDRTGCANDRPALADITPHGLTLPKNVVAPHEYAGSHLRVERHAGAEIR